MRIALAIILILSPAAIGQHPSVGIVGVTQGNTESQGSGCIIANDEGSQTVLVLTAKHVIDGGGRIWFNPPGSGKRFYATEVHRHPNQDLAMFSVPREGLSHRKAMKLWTGELKPGMQVWSEGFGNVRDWPTDRIGKPLWTHGNYAFARLRGEFKRPLNGDIVDFSLPSIPGDSGSPIFVSYQGEPYLVGVTMASDYTSGRPTTTTAPHVGPIRKWIQTLGWRIRRARSQADYYTYGSVIQSDGGVQFGNGILFGRNHPAPYGGPQCIPGQGCIPPQLSQPEPPALQGFEPIPAPQPIAPRPAPPAGQQFDQLMERQLELLEELKNKKCPAPREGTFSLPGQLRAEFDTSRLKADLLEELASDPRFRGRDGRNGRDGKDGRNGRDAVSPVIDEGALAARVAAMINIPAGMTRSDVEMIIADVMNQYSPEIPVDQIAEAVIQRLPTTPIQTVDPDTGDIRELGSLRLGETFVIPWRRGQQSTPSELGGVSPARHLVLVADKNSRYWPGLEQLITRAKGYYSGIRVADPPDFSVALPQVVGYRDGSPTKTIATGYRDVSALLASIQNGTFKETW